MRRTAALSVATAAVLTAAWPGVAQAVTVTADFAGTKAHAPSNPELGDWYTSDVTVTLKLDVEDVVVGHGGETIDSYRCATDPGQDRQAGPELDAGDTTVTFNLSAEDDYMVYCKGVSETFAYPCVPWIGCMRLPGSFATFEERFRLRIDKTAPTIVDASIGPRPNAAGWNNTDVVLRLTGFESFGRLVACTWGAGSTTFLNTSSLVITTEGSGSRTGTCTNSARLTASTSLSYKIDKTPPTLAPSISPSGVLTRGSVATASANATDSPAGSASGVASSSCGDVDTSAIGTYSVTCTAKDHADNTNSAVVPYTVGYAFGGFKAPINGGDVLNAARAGQTVPLKFSVSDAAGPVADLTTYELTSSRQPCAEGDATDEVVEDAVGQSGLQNLGGGEYQINWKTDKSYTGCRKLELRLDDGVAHDAQFTFTK